MSRIYPSWSQIAELRPQLTQGEEALARFLDSHLPETWSIYVQPYLNDMRPDIVVRNPHIGIVVFEVKDWTLGRYTFEGGRMIARTATDHWIEDDPIKKAGWYSRSIYEQFLVCDEAKLEFGFHPNNMAVCRAAVYFHGADTGEANSLYSHGTDPVSIFGHDALTLSALPKLVPYYDKARANFVRPAQVDALERAHSWLVPPKHALDQQQKTRLTRGQSQYANPDSGFRRIRGVAGAGKSFVLSHRAGRANESGRKVLLLSFNITMSHVLRDLLKRVPYKVDWHMVTTSHFHGWAINQCVDAGLFVKGKGTEDETDFARTKDQDFMRRLMANLEQINSGSGLARDYITPRYGGIYVDEGQDFDPQWLDALAGFLEKDGELVVFADHKQNIYDQDGGRDADHKMRRCRFSGPWAQLPQKSHRLPWRIAIFLNEFALKTSLGDSEDMLMEDYAERPVQGDLALDIMAWRNVDSVQHSLDILDDALSSLGNPNPGDVVILMPTHEMGLLGVQRLSAKYHQIVHVFGEGGADSPESRRRKLAFWMGRGGLKMCTIHSFKGWEMENVIIIWPSDDNLPNLTSNQRASLFYTAVSRGMRNVVVLNANRGYDQYSNGWDTVTQVTSLLSSC